MPFYELKNNNKDPTVEHVISQRRLILVEQL